MLIISSTSIFLYHESPPEAITQTGTVTATTAAKQSSDQNHTFAETSKIIDGGNMSIILKLLSNIVETRINKSSSLLELTSKLPEVTNVSYANMITKKFMGIPQSLDLQKRDIARNILEKDSGQK